MEGYSRYRGYKVNGKIAEENFIEDYTDRLNKLGIIGVIQMVL